MILSFKWQSNARDVKKEIYLKLEAGEIHHPSAPMGDIAEIISIKACDDHHQVNVRTCCEDHCARISIALDLAPCDVEMNS